MLVNGPVDSLPEVALAPDHAPEAEQEVKLLAEDQTSNEAEALVTSEGIPASDTPDCGGGGVTDSDVAP